MSVLFSTEVPCAYSSTGRLPLQVLPLPDGTMMAVLASVSSRAEPTVWYLTV